MKKKTKKNRLVIGLGIFFGLVVFTFISVQITSRPNFCTTCHYMEPYYESWKASVHNDVTCTECHFPPGLAGTIRGKMEGLVQIVNYVSSSYSRRKPWAEIEDASCLRSGCHETQKLNVDVIFKGVHFNHKSHLNEMRRGKKLRCTSCHSQIVQGDHIKVTETTCFLCHFKESEYRTTSFVEKLSDCKKCHQWKKYTKEERSKLKFDHIIVTENNIACKRCHTNPIVGDGFVPKENCYKCHWDNERLGRYDEIDLIHTTHIEKHKVECISCHMPIQHKINKLDPQKELNCNMCHTNMHHEQKALFTGKKIDSIEGIPNPMYTVGLDCSSCHIYHETIAGDSGVKIANPQSCETCHGKGYAKLLKMWEKSTDKKMLELKNNIGRAYTAISASSAKVRNKAKNEISKSEQILHLLNKGKAIHNVTYSAKLINKGNEYLNEALKIVNAGFQFTVDSSASTVPSECRNCHVGVEDLDVTHNNKKFKHDIHLNQKGVECYTCHTNEKQHGQLKLTDAQCASCHHNEPEELDCGKCHTIEYAIQSGDFMGIGEPDVMFDSDVTCADCHLTTEAISIPGKEMCIDCHDEEYSEIRDEWIETYDASILEVENRINKLRKIYKKGFPKNIEEIYNKLIIIKSTSANSIHNHLLIIEALEQMSTTLDEYLIPD